MNLYIISWDDNWDHYSVAVLANTARDARKLLAKSQPEDKQFILDANKATCHRVEMQSRKKPEIIMVNYWEGLTSEQEKAQDEKRKAAAERAAKEAEEAARGDDMGLPYHF